MTKFPWTRIIRFDKPSLNKLILYAIFNLYIDSLFYVLSYHVAYQNEYLTLETSFLQMKLESSMKLKISENLAIQQIISSFSE